MSDNYKNAVFDNTGNFKSLPLLLLPMNTLGFSYDTIPSTNSKAWELIDQGIKPPFYVTAQQQTAGRGQRGNVWISSVGGLYLTYATLFEYPMDRAPHLMLLTVWGIVNRLRQENIPVGIKWFNDLILESKKLGGIKTEIRTRSHTIHTAIIGVGINVLNPTPSNGIALNRVMPQITLSHAQNWVIQGIEQGFQDYQKNGINLILKSYQELVLNMGQTIEFQGSKGEITGVTAQGELQIHLSSPRSQIYNLPIGSLLLGYDFN
jgi:BirA family biotin operon repressor/biotin-[acetyl-CoA-carboxylase] ligase